MRSLFSLLAAVLLLAACVPSQATEAIPTPGLPRPTATATTRAEASTPSPAPTDAPATRTPEAATPTLEAAAENIVHLEPGTAITLTALEMLDATTGWGIGGTGSLGDHVLRTTDGGLTWADVTPPEPAITAPAFTLAIDAHGHFPDADTAWVVYGLADTSAPTAIQVWHTTNGGAAWTGSEPIDASDLGVSDFFAPSDLHFVDAQTGWFLAHLGVGMNHDYIAVYATTDGGANWAPVLGPQSEGPQSCGKTGLRFVDAQNGWLTGDCQGVAPGLFLYRSADGGATWQSAELPPPASAADLFTRSDAGCGTNSLTLFGAQAVTLAVNCLILSTEPIGTQAFVYASTDRGASWVSHPAPSRGLSFIDPQTGWALPLTFGFNPPPFELARTTDGGATWTPMAEVDWYGQPDFVDAQAGWAIAHTDDASRLVHTTDAGATWAELEPVIGP